MFDFSVVHEPVASRQRAAVRQTIDRAIANRSITITDVLMAPEPISTMALEYLDGCSSESGLPQTTGTPKEIGPVRLVCVSPNDEIKIAYWGSRNIYGTTEEAAPMKLTKSLGNVADVADTYPQREARNVLRSRGFPIRNLRSRGANEGSVIEWKWLERRAKEDDAPDEIRAIYDQLLARMTTPNAAPPATKSKSAGSAPANP